LFAAFSVILVAADFAFPPPLSRAGELSTLVLDREDRWVHAFATPAGRWRFGADLDAIDQSFIERLIAIEDKRFLAHDGVDAAAIMRAAASAAKAGRFVSGASTITMQTARLLEPRPRTLVSKLVEMIRARQIERRLSKREILELYLTLAPYGGNLEGVRAASLSYFGKEPAHLSDAEQALLIALPQAPEARRPDRRPEAARIARADILRRLVGAGALSPQLAAEAEGARLPEARRAMPVAAYHLARELALGERKNGPVVRSSLDLPMQVQGEALVRAYAEGLSDGATAALIVVDNRRRAVRALVGSSGSDVDGGWIDLTRARRSPGSTLKPFIYGLAMEDGLIGPDTLIEDMPRSFGGYAPENFDRTFRGEVRAADALQHSLNLPAVRVLDRLGAERLAAVLGAAGVRLAGPKRADTHFGLTLALGGAGVALRDLCVPYVALANGGAAGPLAWTAAEEDAAQKTKTYQLFSAASAGRISAILADAPALEGRAPSALSQSAPRVAFKTGTSYGYRDAWAAGHDGAYTVVVWVGRADGAARPGETGRKAAAPLLMDVFDMLARTDPEAARRQAPEADDTEIAIARLSAPRRETPPEITFPRDGVELYGSDFDGEARGFALAARGGAGDYRWYVDGETIAPDALGARSIWRPEGPGFYELVVVDAAGRSARAKVRIAVGG
jgi:penicillin-binding protein 1C